MWQNDAALKLPLGLLKLRLTCFSGFCTLPTIQMLVYTDSSGCMSASVKKRFLINRHTFLMKTRIQTGVSGCVPVPSEKRFIINPFFVLLLLPMFLLAGALLIEPLPLVAKGMLRIMASPSLLLTDYIAVGGPGAAMLNAALCGLIACLLIYGCKININGPFIAAVYTVIGFAFFGKNILNIWPIIGGVWLFSKYQKVPFRNYMVVALFGTTLAPLISYIAFGAQIAPVQGLLIGTAFGMAAGFVLPVLASHMLRFHDGYNIYNIGFTGGLIGSAVTALLRSFDFPIKSESILSSAEDSFFKIYLNVFFLTLIGIGIFMSRANFPNLLECLRRIHRSSGRLVSDFVQIGDNGSVFLNMGIMGVVSSLFILILRGEFNGPVIGGCLTVVGFAAFGKHILNCTPIMAGVTMASLFKIWDPSTTEVIIAGLFGTTLAPIAGQYGPFAGIAAGFFHLSIVMNVGILHGGINLYNNGFAGGFVAAMMVPLLDVFKRKGGTDAA